MHAETPESSSVELVKRWRNGDESAATELHDKYLAKLVEFAKQHLNEKFRKRIDAQDLVQSIYRSVFRVTRERSIEFTDDTGFWKWLATLALNKTYNRVKYLEAGSRNPSREGGRAEDASLRAISAGRYRSMPSSEEVVELADLLETILKALEPTDQQILQFRIEGFTQQEIAERLNVDPRTVRRRLESIRERVREISEAEPLPELN